LVSIQAARIPTKKTHFYFQQVFLQIRIDFLQALQCLDSALDGIDPQRPSANQHVCTQLRLVTDSLDDIALRVQHINTSFFDLPQGTDGKVVRQHELLCALLSFAVQVLVINPSQGSQPSATQSNQVNDLSSTQSNQVNGLSSTQSNQVNGLFSTQSAIDDLFGVPNRSEKQCHVQLVKMANSGVPDDATIIERLCASAMQHLWVWRNQNKPTLRQGVSYLKGLMHSVRSVPHPYPVYFFQSKPSTFVLLSLTNTTLNANSSSSSMASSTTSSGSSALSASLESKPKEAPNVIEIKPFAGFVVNINGLIVAQTQRKSTLDQLDSVCELVVLIEKKQFSQQLSVAQQHARWRQLATPELSAKQGFIEQPNAIERELFCSIERQEIVVKPSGDSRSFSSSVLLHFKVAGNYTIQFSVKARVNDQQKRLDVQYQPLLIHCK